MYAPAASALMGIAALGPFEWLVALAGATVAVGWRVLVPGRGARR